VARRTLSVARFARELVVRTATWPLLGRGYREIYRLQTARVKRALADVDGVRSVLLRGSTLGGVRPGISDIDLVVIVHPDEPARRLATLETVYRRVARINRGAPLVRDVHVFTPAALSAMARQASGLHATILSDTTPLLGLEEIPEAAQDPTLWRETLLREVLYWTTTSLLHLADADHVGSALAARSHAKALAAFSAFSAFRMHGAAAPSRGLADLAAAYAEKRVTPADPATLFELMARTDEQCAGETSPELALEPRQSHPNIAGALDDARRATAELAGQRGVQSVVLTVEGARENDLRSYVAVDPRAADARGVIASLGRLIRRKPFSRERFSRLSYPQVVTRRAFERAMFLRWAAAEPVARRRHGEVLHGDDVIPRGTSDEIRRAVALELATAAMRVNEVVTSRLDGRGAAELADVAWGLVPAARVLAETGRVVTRYVADAPENADERRRVAMTSRAFRVSLLADLEARCVDDVPRLLAGPRGDA
jgi:predicted nucleotidyltransferase